VSKLLRQAFVLQKLAGVKAAIHVALQLDHRHICVAHWTHTTVVSYVFFLCQQGVGVHFFCPFAEGDPFGWLCTLLLLEMN